MVHPKSSTPHLIFRFVWGWHIPSGLPSLAPGFKTLVEETNLATGFFKTPPRRQESGRYLGAHLVKMGRRAMAAMPPCSSFRGPTTTVCPSRMVLATLPWRWRWLGPGGAPEKKTLMHGIPFGQNDMSQKLSKSAAPPKTKQKGCARKHRETRCFVACVMLRSHPRQHFVSKIQ